MTDLLDLSASQLLDAYARRKASPREMMDRLIRRVEAVEPMIGALYAFDPDGARAEARASTERWARGRPRGPLDGVPVTLKELIATKGVAVPMGSRATELTPAPCDSPVAARLREAGAIIFAKTTCPDYGMLSSGLSSFHPLTRNPWNPACNPGGSSAGAAAAAAAGYGPLHVGTDIGGSVRLPAGWNGLVGVKPSLGRIPIDPYYVGRCAGPMTRTVRDAALLMIAIARPDPRDAMSLPPQDIDWADLKTDISGLKIGLMMDAGCGIEAENEVKAAVQNAARFFAQAGAVLVDVPPVLTGAMLDGLDVYWRARFWGMIRALDEDKRALILPYIRDWAQAAETIDGVSAIAGFDQTIAIRAACAALFQRVDVVISPVNPLTSYPAEWASPTNDPARPFEHIAFTLPWNMSEQPALSIHCGFSSGGIPIGMQIVTRRFADQQLLQLARSFEAVHGPIRNGPGQKLEDQARRQ
ncbi:MAG: amidase [Rhodospirillaceae bacterium]|nr:amidase [Rhodospirillaceae bacterium]